MHCLAVPAFVAGLACVLAPCPAQKYTEKERQEIAALKKRAEARHDELLRLKNAGSVGETDDGLVAVTKSELADDRTDPKNDKSPTIGEVVESENTDRKKLYAIFARGNETDPEKVAHQATVVHFKHTLPDHYVRVKGKWIQRKALKLEEKKGEEKDKEKEEEKDETKEKKKGEADG